MSVPFPLSVADSRPEKAVADGGVKIVATTVNGVRIATADHSEYFTGDQKVILTGGRPRLVDDRSATRPRGPN